MTPTLHGDDRKVLAVLLLDHGWIDSGWYAGSLVRLQLLGYVERRRFRRWRVTDAGRDAIREYPQGTP